MRPTASVIIATRNRADLLEQTLRHMAAQVVPGGSWEIIVVDNGSTDRTPAVLEAARAGLPLVALREPTPGKNRAVNRALDRAQGELLVFTDDDVIAVPQWLAQLVSASRRWAGADVFGGRILHEYPEGTPQWMRAPSPHAALNLGHYSFSDPEGPTRHLPHGANLAIRATALAHTSFCETIGPDSRPHYATGSETELLQRLIQGGAQVVYVPDATVFHVVQPFQLRQPFLYNRSFSLGRGHVRKRQRFTTPAVFWLGAPRYLWRMLAEAGTRHALSLLSRRRRIETGLEFHYLRGALHEFRQAAPPSAVRQQITTEP